MKRQFLFSTPTRKWLRNEKHALLNWFLYGPIAAFIVFGFDAVPVIDAYRVEGKRFVYGLQLSMDTLREEFDNVSSHVVSKKDTPLTDSRPEPTAHAVTQHLLPRDELTIFYSEEDQERIREARRQKHQEMMDDVRERYSREKFRLMRLRKVESEANEPLR